MTTFFKRLELQGFKSFAHKTSIEFLDGVTVVVGPNGCGKSNVLDAIRWVLGETSAKSLRGGKMGDVIFRGSASQKAANFAQINLITNNSAGTLKMDHEEVMVTRRLFSNGESNYQLNKETCRMRNISELFMDTGLGADNYAVIEQGRISDMIAQKPAERRALFEEAAGISRYKARREEALRKLIRTEEDLLRLFDIITEVEKQTNSLQRQARKAVSYRRLSRRLRRAQLRLLLKRWQDFKSRQDELTQRQKVALDALEEANAKYQQAEAEFAELRLKSEDFQNRRQSLQQEKYDLEANLTRQKHRVEMARERLKTMEERSALLEREISSTNSRYQVLKGTLEALGKDVEVANAQAQAEQAELNLLESKLKSLRQQGEESSRSVSQGRQELQSLKAKEAKIQQDITRAQSLLENLDSEISRHDGELNRIQELLKESSGNVGETENKLLEQRNSLSELEAEKASILKEISSSESTRSSRDEEMEALSAELGRAANRLHALEELEKNYDGFYKGVKEVMKAGERGNLTGLVGVVSNLIAAPKDLEIALEIALGAHMQDIITVSVRDAKSAIEMLRKNQWGRATFLPLDDLEVRFNKSEFNGLLKRNGVVGLARELAEFDPKVQVAVDYLLRNTVIVDHIDVATGLRGEGIRTRMVSLTGDVVFPDGVLTGGSHQSRGLLSRSREIRQLRDKVTGLQAKYDAAVALIREEKTRLSGLHARSAELQNLIHSGQMKENSLKKDFEVLQQRLKEQRNQMASLDARRVQQMTDQQSWQASLSASQDALAGLAAEIAERESFINDYDLNFGKQNEEISTLQEEVSQRRARHSALQERHRSILSKRDDIERELANSQGDEKARQGELESLKAEKTKQAEELKAADSLIAILVNDRDAKAAELSALEQENSADLQATRQAESKLQFLRREKAQRDNEARDLEVSLAEVRGQVATLQEEARQEFQCEVEELEEFLNQAETGDQFSEDLDDEEEAAQIQKDEEIVELNELRGLVGELRGKLQRLGSVNEEAIEQYQEARQRFEFLSKQRDDLLEAKDSLTQTIKNIDGTTGELFHKAYETIRKNFQSNFRKLFSGGEGDLVLIEDENSPEPGIDIFAQPPGKQIGGSLNLMSGGEKAMTAIALMFSLFQFKPSPICILDEIDAPLDDANVTRLCNAVKEFSQTTQFLIITHNKLTMSLADTIYGVTMQEPGISKLVSVRFSEVEASGLLDEGATG